MLNFLFIILKLILGFFAIKGELSLIQLYLLNTLTVGFTYLMAKKTIKHSTWIFSVVLIDFSIPLLGFFALVLFTFLSPWYRKSYQNYNRHWKNDDQSDPEQLFNRQMQIQTVLTQKVELNSLDNKLHESVQIQPYIDIFLGEDTELKISACMKLSRFQNFQSVQLLKIALQDNEYEVRYMANNSLENIEKKLIDKIDLLSENIDKFPTIMAYYKERAYTYLTIYNLSILDSYLGKMFLQRALDDLRHALRFEPDSFHLYLTIAQTYTYLDMNTEVITLVEKATQLDLTEEEKTKLYYYRCEAYFKTGSIHKVVHDSKQINSEYMNFDKVKESVDYWRGMSHD